MPRNRAGSDWAINGREFLSIRCLFGYKDVLFYVLIGGRERGKSYIVEDFCLNRSKKGDRLAWMRVSVNSIKKMIANNADKMFDADLVRKYDLELKTKGNDVYNRGGKICSCFALSEMAKWKGVALFDNEDDSWLNIVLDEFNPEYGLGGEKRTQDVVYNFINMVENLARSKKEKMRIFLIANQLEECSDLLLAFNFLPEDYGIFYLKKKRAVIYNIPNGHAYEKRRRGTVADILGGDRYRTFSNALDVDMTRIYKGRLTKPTRLLHFGNNIKYVLWDDAVISEWKGEKVKNVIAMRPYIDGVEFIPDLRDRVFELFDLRKFMYRTLICQKKFKRDLSLLKPRK